MSRILLKYHSSQQLVHLPNVALIILTDEEEKRQIAVLCDTFCKVQLDIRSHGMLEDSKNDISLGETASLRKKMLPEVLCSIINYMTNLDLRVVITHIYDGLYCSVLEDKYTGTTFPIRTSDAILYAVANSHVPIYIEEELWKHQSVEHKESSGVSIPINALPTEMLEISLEKAIEEENYEAAKQLKEEMEKRHK